jgi:hypothetical protein
MQAAVALTDAIWVERNYPIPSTQEQADLVRATGSIEMAYEAMPHYLGEHRETFMELTAEKRPPGETLELFLLAVSDCGSLEIARRRLAPSAYVESLAS